MSESNYAEVFPPGEFLREELEARNWTQLDLATVLGRPPRLVNEIILAKRAITPETAAGLAEALGTSAELWMRLESVWQLSRLAAKDEAISKRAKLYNKFPVNEILKRGWIEPTDNLDLLQSKLLEFSELSSLDQEPIRAHAFRKNNATESPTGLQLAWFYRARHLARTMVVPRFSEEKLKQCLNKLRTLLPSPEEIRHVPKLLSEAGIRFVMVEAFQGSKIDGVCFWLDRNSPVVAISIRYDRIDWFWFTLIHELRHVANGDGRDIAVLDVDLVGDDVDRESINEIERRADAEASEYLIPRDVLNNFMVRTRPLYAEVKIIGFADRIGVHPGIVIGRLQRLKEIPYANLRKYLVKTRHVLAQTSLVDGWRTAVSTTS